MGLKGNMTTELWATMGIQQEDSGGTRHGQSCYLYVYPQGDTHTRQEIEGYLRESYNPQEAEPDGPIDQVMGTVMENFIQCEGFEVEPGQDYDGLRVGAGWIYASLAVARAHGATYASVIITSNDGNLSMQAWDKDKGVLVTAVHHTYYGS